MVSAARLRHIGLLVIPAMAVSIVVLGLRAGVTGPLHGAIVYGAPISDNTGHLAWQVATFTEERLAKDFRVVQDLTVTARVRNVSATWRGSTNDEGIAEFAVDLPGFRAEDAHALSLEVRDAREVTALAIGTPTWAGSSARSIGSVSFSKYGRRDGDVLLDVAITGFELPTGFATPIWVRATDRASGKPLGGVGIVAAPEYGVRFASTRAETDARGWASFAVTAVGNAGAATLSATDHDGRTGAWGGTLAIAPGAFNVVLQERIAQDTTASIRIEAPTTRGMAYGEIDDATGRVAAATLTLAVEENGVSAATFVTPKLREGIYFFIAAVDAQAASTTLRGSSVRAFFVAASDDAARKLGPVDDVGCAGAGALPPKDAARALGPCLALAAGGPFPRWTALDGFEKLRVDAYDKQARGANIGIASVTVAFVLEAFLILQTIAASRRKMKAAQDTRPELAHLESRFQSVSIAVGLLVALLGFGFVAVMLMR